jgi:hypothetical protein
MSRDISKQQNKPFEFDGMCVMISCHREGMRVREIKEIGNAKET